MGYHTLLLQRVTQTQLVRVVMGNSSGPTPAPSPAPHLSRLPHTALYLSLAGVTEDSPDGADIRLASSYLCRTMNPHSDIIKGNEELYF